jgi:preprotein translocase subunit SecG
MEVVKIIVIILECLASVALIAAVLFQSGKEAGLGALMGNNETFMSKGNADTLDKKLASATKWIALAWALLALILSLF